MVHALLGPPLIITELSSDLLGEPAPYDTDLNTMTKGGVWMVQTDEDKIEQNNFPQGVVNGWVRVYRNSNGATKQVFYRYGTNDKTDGYVYTRTYNVNSKNWSQWTSYARMSDLDKGQFVVKVEENIQKVITSQSDIVRGTLPSQMKDCAYAAVGFSTTIDNELSIVVDGNSIIVSPKKTNNAVTINWFQFN